MIRFDAAGDALVRTTDLPGYNGPYTWCAWCELLANTPYQTIFSFNDGSWTNYDRVITLTGTTTLYLDIASGASLAGSTVGTGVRFHLALVRTSDTAASIFRNGLLDAAVTHGSVLGRSLTRMDMGQNTPSGDPMNGRVEQVRVWNGYAMSGPELLREAMSSTAVRRANLYGDWPMLPGPTRSRDMSRWQRHWTEAGALTDEGRPILGRRARRLISIQAPALSLPTNKPVRMLRSIGFPRGFLRRRHPEDVRRRRLAGRGAPA